MNLFKILANGHGTVNENNVSAFFAYLTDPNETHSLDREFISRFLKPIIKDKDFNLNHHDSEVFLEQTFINGDKSQTVDIVIVFYRTERGIKSKSHLTSFINNEKAIEKIILIENKIKIGSLTVGQVSNQRESAQEDLKIPEEDIYSIYLTPDHYSFEEEFKTITNNFSTHCLWYSTDESKTSIVSILKEIINDENHGNIEPISEYTKQTIKAFVQFVKSDFKSENTLKEKKEGLHQRDLHNNFETYSEKYHNNLNKESLEIVKNFVKYLETIDNQNVKFRLSKTHPVSVFYKGKKLLGINAWGLKIKYDLMFLNENIQNLFINIGNEYQEISFHENDSKRGARVVPNSSKAKEIIQHFDQMLKALEE